jgi:hypothetical protein
MKSQTMAIAGCAAALAFAAAPVSAIAASDAHHRPATASQLDRSRDARGVRHSDNSRDLSKDRADHSRDLSKDRAEHSRDVGDR